MKTIPRAMRYCAWCSANPETPCDAHKGIWAAFLTLRAAERPWWKRLLGLA